MNYAPIATGTVASLSINGEPVEEAYFTMQGPRGDKHAGFYRQLSGHDIDYVRTSNLKRGDPIFNWRTWTGLSVEEIREIERKLGHVIPQGCLLENIVVEGIPNFSKLPPTSRLVFPEFPAAHPDDSDRQAVLAVWEENTPCKVVGKRLEDHHGVDGLMTRFREAAEGLRGVMGLVLSPGKVKVGDFVLVYPPTGMSAAVPALEVA